MVVAEKILHSRIVQKHDIESNWNSTDFIPKQGEIIVYDADENYTYERLKIGDGTTLVSSLPFISDDIRNLINILIGDTPVSEQISISIKDVLYKTQQELTVDEVNQVRQNIHSVGQYATGLIYTPYDVVETGLNTSNHTVTETPLDPVEAAIGAEIYNDYDGNIATGSYAIATGYKTQAVGNYSRSNGWWTKASGQCSNAEGLLSVASGSFAHAEGTRTKATKNNTHSEGDLTVASGNSSHAEGVESQATGNVSHAEGWKTTASGIASHSEGEGTIAGGRGQTAMGKYNVKDTTSLLVVGKGTSDTARKNAFVVDKNGGGWFSNGITVGENKASVITDVDYIIFDGGTSTDFI